MHFADPEQDTVARERLRERFASRATMDGVPGSTGRGVEIIMAYHDWLRDELARGTPADELVSAVGALLGHIGATTSLTLAHPGHAGALHGILNTETRIAGLRCMEKTPLAEVKYHAGKMN